MFITKLLVNTAFTAGVEQVKNGVVSILNGLDESSESEPEEDELHRTLREFRAEARSHLAPIMQEVRGLLHAIPGLYRK